MFFEIGTKEYDPNLSFIFAKHPDSVFDRDLSNGRKVVGQFVKPDNRLYRGHTENDPLSFLQKARKLNLSNYVHVQLSAVCPDNLKGLDEIFRSAMRGKNGKDITSEEFFKPRDLEAMIGPYPKNFAFIQKMFNSININANIVFDDINKEFNDEGTVKDILDYKDPYMLSLKTKTPISVTEFLQKIYLISYYNTTYYFLTRINDEQIEKFVSLCSSWLETSEFRNSIVNTLCRKNRNLIKKFETSLIEGSGSDTEDKKSKIEDLDKILNKDGLHQKRHNIVIQKLKSLVETYPEQSLVDLGCGIGQLLKKITKTEELKNIGVLGIEADGFRADKAKYFFKKQKNIKILNSNLLYPNILENSLLPDMLTSIEVIEHLEKEDRKKMVESIINLFQPKELILSTPNIVFNKEFDMPPGELRHKDHRIEYTKEQFEEEVVIPLQTVYDIEYIDLLPDMDEQPSFVIYGKHREPDKRIINHKLLANIQKMYNPIYLDIANYNVIPREISKGYASRQMLCNQKHIFYLAPTISPVEYDPNNPDYLEHPDAGFKYFQNRGINLLVAEEKYMGSRGYVLLFKELGMAQAMGFNMPIVINSRQGFPFFKDDMELLDIWATIRDKMANDFIMLDCEILPWILKAKKLINGSFKTPGQCTYLSRKYGEYGDIDNAKSFLDTLDEYSRDEDLQIRMFQVLAYGEVDIAHRKFKNYVNGLISLNRDEQQVIFKSLGGDIFKPVVSYKFRLDDEVSKQEVVRAWEKYCCASGGEGFVLKPYDPIVYLKSGYLVQPAVKVRGKDYLRLIYGIDYLEKDYFAKVRSRKVGNKRALAIKEFELSLKILRSFLYQNKRSLHQHVAGFIGMENNFIPGIDATL